MNIVSKVPEIIKLCVDVIKVTYPIGIRVKERNRINGLFPPDMLILYHGSKSKQLSHRLEKTTRSNSETMELVYNELDGTRENEMSEKSNIWERQTEDENFARGSEMEFQVGIGSIKGVEQALSAMWVRL